MSFDNGLAFLQDYIAKTEPFLEDYFQKRMKDASTVDKFPAEVTSKFYEILKKGKKLRGSLTVLSYLACGGKNIDDIYKASTIMEIVHAGVLVVDDMMDNGDFRRGLPTIHKFYESETKKYRKHCDPKHFGISVALVAQLYSYFISMGIFAECKFDHSNMMEALKVYEKYYCRLGDGQLYEFVSAEKENISEEEVLKILWIKSGEYTCLLPMLFGAVLAGQHEGEKLNVIKSFAMNLGGAFQIGDDILGMFGDDKVTGKPADSDLKEGKNTLFVSYLNEHGTKEQLEFKRKVFGKADISCEDVVKFREILKTCGAYDYVLSKGEDYVLTGKKFINKITDDKKLQVIFTELIEYMVRRDK